MIVQIILKIDKSIFFFFQNLQRPWLDYLLAWPTRLGEVLILIGVICAGILIFDRRGLMKILVFMVSIPVSNWISELLKVFFK